LERVFNTKNRQKTTFASFFCFLQTTCKGRPYDTRGNVHCADELLSAEEEPGTSLFFEDRRGKVALCDGRVDDKQRHLANALTGHVTAWDGIAIVRYRRGRCSFVLAEAKKNS
jgi:hypothetical protein